LPVLANLHPASAALGFFRDVVGSGMRLARNPDSLVEELTALSEPTAWSCASVAAVAFGKAHLDSRLLRNRIYDHAATHVGVHQ
jgi:hypothetical protein